MGIDAHGIVNAIITFIIHAVDALAGKRRRMVNVLKKIEVGSKQLQALLLKVLEMPITVWQLSRAQ
jgi:hypothetical protein